MKSKPHNSNLQASLTWPERYIQIAVMVEAGLPIGKALSTVKKGLRKADPKLDRVLGLVNRGKVFADSLNIAGILSSFDYRLIKNAELAGKLGLGLRHIADERISQIQRVRSLRAGLLLPKAVLVIGALAGIVIKISVSQFRPIDAVLSVGMVIVIFFLLSECFERLLLTDVRRWLSWLWPIKLIRNQSERYQRLFELVFFRNLIWQLNSGIAGQEAVKNCGDLLKSCDLHERVSNAALDLGNGNSLPQSLEKYDLVLSKRMRQVLQIAQESGRYQQAIEHEIVLQQGKLKQDANALFRWLPRAYYLVVLIVLARFVLVF